MNKTIKKNLNLYLEIFIILQPIIDLITGICLNIFNLNLTIGILIRMFFLLGLVKQTTINKTAIPSINNPLIKSPKEIKLIKETVK